LQDRSLLSPTHRPNAQHHHICEKRPVQKTYRRAPQKRPITRERHIHTCESLPPNTNTQHHHLCENQTSLPPTYTQKRTHTQMHTWESPPPNTNISAPHIHTETHTHTNAHLGIPAAKHKHLCAPHTDRVPNTRFRREFFEIDRSRPTHVRCVDSPQSAPQSFSSIVVYISIVHQAASWVLRISRLP